MPLPWHVRVDQADDGNWVAEVTFPNLPSSVLMGIAQSAERYQQISRPQLATCYTIPEDPARLFFVVGKALEARPVQILENPSCTALSEPECRLLAGDLADSAQTLHRLGLGLWVVDPRLLWKVKGKHLFVPAFWLPLTGGAGAGRLAPEIAGTSELPAFDLRSDIFTIAFNLYGYTLTGRNLFLCHSSTKYQLLLLPGS